MATGNVTICFICPARFPEDVWPSVLVVCYRLQDAGDTQQLHHEVSAGARAWQVDRQPSVWVFYPWQLQERRQQRRWPEKWHKDNDCDGNDNGKNSDNKGKNNNNNYDNDKDNDNNKDDDESNDNCKNNDCNNDNGDDNKDDEDGNDNHKNTDKNGKNNDKIKDDYISAYSQDLWTQAGTKLSYPGTSCFMFHRGLFPSTTGVTACLEAKSILPEVSAPFIVPLHIWYLM